MPTLRSALVLLALASLATSAHATDSDSDRVADRFGVKPARVCTENLIRFV